MNPTYILKIQKNLQESTTPSWNVFDANRQLNLFQEKHQMAFLSEPFHIVICLGSHWNKQGIPSESWTNKNSTGECEMLCLLTWRPRSRPKYCKTSWGWSSSSSSPFHCSLSYSYSMQMSHHCWHSSFITSILCVTLRLAPVVWIYLIPKLYPS